jgi:alpha/beta hydrolase fold
MPNSLDPLSVLAAAESSTTDLTSARSVTLIIHGVGNQTSEGLLGDASNGYIGSELHGVSRRTTLTECPALSDEKGAQSLVLSTSAGDHFVVALPWAGRRTRLSSIAKWSAGLLLLVTIAMGVSFIFRGTLEWLEHWLDSWVHRLIAYALMTGFSYAFHVLTDASDREFKRPSMSYLFLPPLLLIGLMFFVEGTWLWIATAVLIVALWLTSTVIVTRCFLVAPSLGWRVALAALLVAMSLPSAAILRIARHSAIRAEREYGALDSPYIHLPRNMPSLPFLDNKTQPDSVMENAPFEKPRFNGKADDSTPDLNQRPPHFGDKTDFEKQPVPSAATRTSTPGRDPVADAEASDSALNGGDAFMKALLKYKPSIVDLVTEPEFMAKCILALVCIGLCVLVMGYSWLLDFGFDVLQYGGSSRHRTSLIDAMAKTIRWFHEQAQNARIVVVGHSLGSVIAAQTIASLSTSESPLTGVVLVTLGSPLNYIGRAFPKSVPQVRELGAAIRGSACMRWINLSLASDLIGKSLDIGNMNTVQYCVGKGGHTKYWSSREVWEAVAFEALGIGERSVRERSGPAEACVFERSLGLLVFASIIVIGSCGVGLWLLSR